MGWEGDVYRNEAEGKVVTRHGASIDQPSCRSAQVEGIVGSGSSGDDRM